MNEEPLHLIPAAVPRRMWRPNSTQAAAKTTPAFDIEGELDPFCRFMYYQRLKKYDGDWTR